MTIRPARMRVICLALACSGVGALAGSVAASSIAGRSPHQDGACIALRMAATYGYLDERQQRVVMRALATATNPDAHLFPGGYRAMRQACGLASGQGS
jgi:hypothetical protein